MLNSSSLEVQKSALWGAVPNWLDCEQVVMDDNEEEFMAPIGGNTVSEPRKEPREDDQTGETGLDPQDGEDDGYMAPIKPTSENNDANAKINDQDEEGGFMTPMQDQSADLLKMAEGDVSEKRREVAGRTMSERRRVFDALTSGNMDAPISKLEKKAAKEEEKLKKQHKPGKAVVEDSRTATERAEESLLNELRDKDIEEWKPEYNDNQYMQHGLEKDREHRLKEEEAKKHYHHDHQIDGKATYLISEKELKGFNRHHQHLAGYKEGPKKNMHLEDGTYLGHRGEVVEGGAYQYDDDGKYISIDAGMRDDEEEPHTYTKTQAGCMLLIGLPFILLYIIAITPYQCLRGDFHSGSGINSLRESFKETRKSVKRFRQGRKGARANRDERVYIDDNN